MKKSLKLFTFLIAFILLISCEKDVNLIDTQKLNYQMVHKDFDFIKQRPSVLKALNEYGKKSTFKSSSDNDNIIITGDFIIYKERVTYVKSNDGSNESYTFCIKRKYSEENILENLILYTSDQITFKAFVVTYEFPNGFDSTDEQLKVRRIESVKPDNFLNFLKLEMCYDEQMVEIKHDCYSGQHSGDSEEYQCNWINDGGTPPYSTWSLEFVEVTCEGGSTPNDGGDVPNDSPYSNPNDPVNSGPTLPPNDDPVAYLANALELNIPQQSFLYNNTYLIPIIYDFLALNNNSQESENFANLMINGLSNNSAITSFDTSLIIDAFIVNDWVKKLKNALALRNYHNSRDCP